MEKERYWSKFADDFEERNTYVVGSENLAIILEKVRQQKELQKTLELGCGNGTFSKILSENATELTATDFSDEMVAVAGKRLQSYENIAVEKADCFNLPYASGSFDTVFMANLLHIIPEPEKAVAECRRVLKENSQLIIVSFTGEGVTLWNKIFLLFRYLKTYGKPSPFAQHLTVAEVKKMFVAQGFTVEEAGLAGGTMKAIFAKGRV